MFRYKNTIEAQEERARKHDCNGVCYSSNYMCPCVEWCEETKTEEAIGWILAYISIILVALSPIGVIVYVLSKIAK